VAFVVVFGVALAFVGAPIPYAHVCRSATFDNPPTNRR
jgi:hypothetical protein